MTLNRTTLTVGCRKIADDSTNPAQSNPHASQQSSAGGLTVTAVIVSVAVVVSILVLVVVLGIIYLRRGKRFAWRTKVQVTDHQRHLIDQVIGICRPFLFFFFPSLRIR